MREAHPSSIHNLITLLYHTARLTHTSPPIRLCPECPRVLLGVREALRLTRRPVEHSMGCETAVHDDDLPGYVAACVRAQEQGRADHLVRVGSPPHEARILHRLDSV